MASFLRHFTFKHPLFRSAKTDNGVPWRESVYYLWWEFLRRHEGYRRTCADAGAGRYAKLYADFGDVHGTDFKAWWTKGDRGARLFAEPPMLMSLQVLERSDLDGLSANWDDSFLVVAIPLSLPKRYIGSRVSKLVRERHTRGRGQRQNKESRALYPIRRQFNFHALKLALDVYDLSKARPSLTQWEIAQQLRFTTTLAPNELGQGGQSDSTITDKKAVMSVAVSRKLRLARQIIENVGKGRFP